MAKGPATTLTSDVLTCTCITCSSQVALTFRASSVLANFQLLFADRLAATSVVPKINSLNRDQARAEQVYGRPLVRVASAPVVTVEALYAPPPPQPNLPFDEGEGEALTVGGSSSAAVALFGALIATFSVSGVLLFCYVRRCALPQSSLASFDLRRPPPRRSLPPCAAPRRGRS